jgi:FtsP/CotA-like multicopper oxidase with cupredoxin domain
MNRPSDHDGSPLAATASRRSFLKTSALGLTAGGLLAACSSGSAEPAPAETVGAGGMGHGAAPAPAAVPATSAREKAEEMDAMHEERMKAFPQPTEGKGNQILKPELVDGVKVFELTAGVLQWETEKGKKVEAWAYNGQVPGPQIRVTEGDRVRVVLKNQLEESSSIHFHGLMIPNAMDGVTFMTQPPVKPGDSFTYEFTARNPGSHMYHSHHNSTLQVGKGLLGAFIIQPKRPRAVEKADIDYVLILNDGFHGFTINGKSFPATEPIVAKKGQKLRIRFMNEGTMIHPMHLHGMPMKVIDKDGWPQPAPWLCDTLNVAPGERWDAIVDCTEPGTWAFHCHILPHAEGEHGMFGMVTALVVK